MFYSQCLLSKKGPLGTVWVAAHCHKRIKKEQVYQTNISSSVDKILVDGVPVVTYRILAYLLLGVVRIYSKKVEYLFHDCRNVLSELHQFAITKKSTRQSSSAYVEDMCAPYSSITLPERFELDTFDLQVIENSSGDDDMAPCEDFTLRGKNEGFRLQSFEQEGNFNNLQYHFEEDAFRFEGHSAGHTPVNDCYSPRPMAVDVGPNISRNPRNSESSMERFHSSSRFSLEECLPPMLFDETEEEADPERTFHEEQPTDMEATKSVHSPMVLGDFAQPEDYNNACDEERVVPEQTKFPEITVLEGEKIQITSQKRPVSISVDVTPEPKDPNASDVTTPEFTGVRTPATKDDTNVSKKRKCLCDEMSVIPNKLYKQGIDDPSNLVKKRRKIRKALHTALFSNKATQMSYIHKSFLKPLIPRVSINFGSLISEEKQKTPEPIEVEEIPAKIDELGSPIIDRSQQEEAIAPSTPVTQSTSVRCNDTRGVTNLERVGPASSSESIEKDPPLGEDREFELSLMNEDLNSCEGNIQEKNNWSARTRAVARYLHKNFLARKKRGADETLNLSRVLGGKTKKESARLFYELLVLKTGGFVNVKQENAYDDISLLETTKLQQACEADGDI